MTTRRQILLRFAAITGSAGMYAAMQALGLADSAEAQGVMPDLKPDSGKGVKVVILGAGQAGLSAAYELGKAGYSCTILEARDRAGGRNFTVRKGTKIEFTDGTQQVCQFDEGQYFNAGPARIPSHHNLTLGYCKAFGVAMETEVNWTGPARIQADRLNGGKPISMRQAIYDYRGHVAEMLAKAAKKGVLDDAFSSEDRQKMLDVLKPWGGLTEALTYDGSEMAGYSTPPGAGSQSATHGAPLPFDVCGDAFVQAVATFADDITFQATMQQPVGGMDRIPAAFEARLGQVIRKGCEVRRIRKRGKGVEIYYYDKVTGQPDMIAADYCICTIPLPVLARVDSDFSKPVKAAIAKNAGIYFDGYKIAFQTPRFWESNDQIYGGLSFTDRDTFMTWYPSDRFHAPEGVLIAGYAFDGNMAKRDMPAQIAYARNTIERLHPGQSGLMKAPTIVHWGQMPYTLGLAGDLAADDRAAFDLLSEPDGPIYFAGDHLSHITSWQQGAFLSSHRVVNQISARQASLKA